MRRQDLDTLEFDALLAELSRHAASAAGKEACRALRPKTNADQSRAELERVADLIALTRDESFPLGDFPDIRGSLAQARTLGARLSGADLLEIMHVLGTMGHVRLYLRTKASGRPRLQRSMASLHELPEFVRRLDRTLDEDGNLRDDASPALRSIRRELRRLRNEIEGRLASLFRSSSRSQIFADEYVTVRNGRFVVPVRAPAQSQLPGIVQDRSSSGETLFIEPLSAVESNNRLLIAAREETEEEIRLLTELTQMVGVNEEALAESFATLVDLDTVKARARFAQSYDGICPRITDKDAAIVLSRARHPLLVLTGRAVTPIDIQLDADTHLLVLTGPNTGGKSVTLKTLGITVLMAQSGIPILAEAGASLPSFDGVWADIGDRQNVADDLSTFSGHIRNLGEILAACGAGSLVLLDEPGTGTDPEDGAALARVLLEELAQRGARVLATTHFQTVKISALNSPAANVAAVDFDPETFAPRYRLIYGSVGPSLGLAMAKRLGLPGNLLAGAERERGELAQSLGDALARLEAERRRYEEETARLGRERGTLHEARTEHQKLATELKEKKKKKWADELAGAKRFADELKSEGKRLLAELRHNPATARRVHQTGLEQSAQIDAKRRETLGTEDASRDASVAVPQVGDEVEVIGKGLGGTLEKILGERAQISRGAIRFDVPTRELRTVRSAGASTSPPRPPGHGLQRALPEEQEGSSSELNLVGSRVARGLERLEAFLDRASVADLGSVRIIHGHGSGALRSAVREFLSSSPYVDHFEEASSRQGGSGATIAYLR